eukprot:CAMPEP_0201536058 /NCGR_PEP_ID=MMETSP0161_2-20130828/60871_1 /ASSEMBLY_ACC=CAM_ASM_000251 /TAXON_ID=180227 /ORGANISM="Neoparamoeba aestuarina, Strain SoJaBio B1-5/56/2" /LENGTH=64 /DNA_ID=CAMNT_0047941557 /DNA_START=15 /DNA_END=206 /DNA_ORIENTATION=-
MEDYKANPDEFKGPLSPKGESVSSPKRFEKKTLPPELLASMEDYRANPSNPPGLVSQPTDPELF